MTKAAATETGFVFDWASLAFGSKKPLRELQATFIAAPRELSEKRFKELVKHYLPQGNIVLGIAKEAYIDGFEGQPQFRSLQLATVQATIDHVNAASKLRNIYVLEYFQRELPYILQKIAFARVALINGSWKHAFHVSPSYYTLVASKTPYELLSPFCDEQEARAYEARTDAEIIAGLDFLGVAKGRGTANVYTEEELLQVAALSARRSYDYNFQTGLSLARRIAGKNGYELLVSTYNRVVPFQTYALLNGSSRETYFSPPNDLNHYDTVHAEVMMLIAAQKAVPNWRARRCSSI